MEDEAQRVAEAAQEATESVGNKNNIENRTILFDQLLVRLSRVDCSLLNALSSGKADLWLALPNKKQKKAANTIAPAQTQRTDASWVKRCGIGAEKIPRASWQTILNENTKLDNIALDAMTRLLLRDLDVRTTVLLPQSSLWLDKIYQ
jgi:hypothetical protein